MEVRREQLRVCRGGEPHARDLQRLLQRRTEPARSAHAGAGHELLSILRPSCFPMQPTLKHTAAIRMALLLSLAGAGLFIAWYQWWPRPAAKTLVDGIIEHTWVSPPPTWSPNPTWSNEHNATLARLWNEVRLRKEWSIEDAQFVVHCLADPPVFTGTDWDQASLAENESMQRFMNTASIFAEHLQLGGTIDATNLQHMKSMLERGLSSPVAYVRIGSVAGLVGVDCLGDLRLRDRIAALEHTDPDLGVRSAVRVQFDNLNDIRKRRAKIQKHEHSRS